MSVYSEPQTPRVDFRVVLRTLTRRKLLLLAPWAIAIVIGLAAAFLLKPIYFSTVTLLLARPQSLSGPLGGMVNGGNPEQQAEFMREQVQNTLFLRSVIKGSGLEYEPATRA